MPLFENLVNRLLRQRHMRRRQAYRALFYSDQGHLNPAARDVLAHLRGLCFASATTHVPGDPYTTAFYEGRRDVWNQIIGYLELEDKEIIKLVEMEDDDHN